MKCDAQPGAFHLSEQSVQQEREKPADDTKADDGVGDRVEVGRVGTGFHSFGSSQWVDIACYTLPGLVRRGCRGLPYGMSA